MGKNLIKPYINITIKWLISLITRLNMWVIYQDTFVWNSVESYSCNYGDSKKW